LSPTTSPYELHPNIYGAAVGFVAWFAVAAWVLFDRQGDIGLPLAMVSVLLLIAVLLPWALFASLEKTHDALSTVSHEDFIP
jgi:hypothetical protein